MRIFALTGGIASGKSTVCRLLRDLCPTMTLFDCDAATRRLHHDARVVEAVRAVFGDEAIFERKNCLDRDFLRQRVFNDAESRGKLEAILHPLIREECLNLLEQARGDGRCDLFVADVPLLFESGFDFGQELSMLVASSRGTQIRRLKQRTRLDDAMVESILAAQMPVEEKLLRADVVFWNEGPLTVLKGQLARFLASQEVTMVEGAMATISASALPAAIQVQDLRQKTMAELYGMAAAIPGMALTHASKAALIHDMLMFYAREGVELVAVGVIDMAKEGFAMVRDPQRSFRPSADDIHMASGLLREHQLRAGQMVKVKLGVARDRNTHLTVTEILTVEGMPLAEWIAPKEFDELTPLFPDRRVIMEGAAADFSAVRIVDLVAPLGMGQRALIVAPPRGGKTILLKQMAKAIRQCHPTAELIVLLLDERPEEVSDFEETVGCTVYSSTFDESPKRHAQVAELVLERAKRLVENQRDVILLLDSLTRLARGYNAAAAAGPIGSGGVSPVALQKSRKFFGAARNVEEGGSLTIVATALVETEARMDDVIFEEFKGTGNMEIRLDRDLAERRIFPAIHIPQSGTRNDDRLYHPDEFVKVLEIRRQLAQLPYGEAIELLLKQMKTTQNNTELLLRGLR